MTAADAPTETMASDLKTTLEGRLDQDKIEAAVAGLKSASTAYPAHGSVASLVFYLKVQVVINDGKTFDGDAWGLAFPGGGALFGDVYTDDLNALYSNTVSFAITATPVYTAVYFFDGGSSLLGHFQAGSVSTVGGSGGGKGSWS